MTSLETDWNVLRHQGPRSPSAEGSQYQECEPGKQCEMNGILPLCSSFPNLRLIKMGISEKTQWRDVLKTIYRIPPGYNHQGNEVAEQRIPGMCVFIAGLFAIWDHSRDSEMSVCEGIKKMFLTHTHMHTHTCWDTSQPLKIGICSNMYGIRGYCVK